MQTSNFILLFSSSGTTARRTSYFTTTTPAEAAATAASCWTRLTKRCWRRAWRNTTCSWTRSAGNGSPDHLRPEIPAPENENPATEKPDWWSRRRTRRTTWAATSSRRRGIRGIWWRRFLGSRTTTYTRWSTPTKTFRFDFSIFTFQTTKEYNDWKQST